MPSIWVDADACPVAIRTILFRAADRTALPLILVANSPIKIPASKHIRAVQVTKGFDTADHYITEQVQPGELVVTQDIPLAAEVVAKDAIALNPRGELYTADNVTSRLALRDIAEAMRDMGQFRGGPSAYGAKEKQAFARELDRWISSAK